MAFREYPELPGHLGLRGQLALRALPVLRAIQALQAPRVQTVPRVLVARPGREVSLGPQVPLGGHLVLPGPRDCQARLAHRVLLAQLVQLASDSQGPQGRLAEQGPPEQALQEVRGLQALRALLDRRVSPAFPGAPVQGVWGVRPARRVSQALMDLAARLGTQVPVLQVRRVPAVQLVQPGRLAGPDRAEPQVKALQALQELRAPRDLRGLPAAMVLEGPLEPLEPPD